MPLRFLFVGTVKPDGGQYTSRRPQLQLQSFLTPNVLLYFFHYPVELLRRICLRTYNVLSRCHKGSINKSSLKADHD